MFSLILQIFEFVKPHFLIRRIQSELVQKAGPHQNCVAHDLKVSCILRMCFDILYVRVHVTSI